MSVSHLYQKHVKKAHDTVCFDGSLSQSVSQSAVTYISVFDLIQNTELCLVL